MAGNQPKSSRWRRFSLRGLLVATTVCCGLLGVWSVYVAPYRVQATACQAVADLYGTYTTEPDDGPAWRRWLVTTLLGDDKFVRLTAIDLGRTAADDTTLELLRGLPHLRALTLDRTRVTDNGLAALATLRELELLSLRYAQVTDAGLSVLQPLPKLQSLSLTGTRISDAAISRLEQQLSLKELFIRWTDVTPAGVSQLVRSVPACQIHDFSEETSNSLE